jgi:hypothetical protein
MWASVHWAAAADLTVRPAQPPTPALSYQLLPDLEVLTPGNAAILYFRAFSPEWFSHRRQHGLTENLDKWKATPLPELPVQELKWLRTYGPLQELDRAARRETCDWQLTERIRQEGISMVLPELQGFRELGKLLALRARLEMAEGHIDKAVFTLQTGFSMGVHLGELPVLISSLVGLAIVHEMLDQVETLIQQPGAPNLYWALTELPRPYIPLRRPLAGDQLGIGIWNKLPDIRELEARPLGRQQLQEYAVAALGLLRGGQDPTIPPPGFGEQVFVAGLTAKFYPIAKQYILEHGVKAERVEAMPTLQVVLLYSLMQYRRLRDDLYKWATLPYWQGSDGVHNAEEQLHRARAQMEEAFTLASTFLPAVARVYVAFARVDRRIAALRCVEAIRLYAADHGGKLPERLHNIAQVPVPIDPMTGKAFIYQAKGDVAILEGPVPPREEPGARASVRAPNSLHYEITLKP